jgi:hypothetical protein
MDLYIFSYCCSGESMCSFTAGCQQPPATLACFSACTQGTTASLVKTYAQDPNKWMQDFIVAYQIMINNGNPNLRLPQ